MDSCPTHLSLPPEHDAHPRTFQRRLPNETVPRSINISLTHDVQQLKVEAPEQYSDCSVNFRVRKAVVPKVSVIMSASRWSHYSLKAKTHAIATSKGYMKLFQVVDLVFRAKPSLRLKSERLVKDVWVH